MPIDKSPEGFAPKRVVERSRPELDPLLSYSGKVGSTFTLGMHAVELTPGASSTCNGTACCCTSSCCW